MTKILTATALALLIATPAFAQSTKADGSKAGKSYASYTSGARAMNRERPWAPPPSINPEYNVYVNGEYIGSDPDPRVRWTLREEERSRFGDD
jgi:hypothetical protein